MVNTNLNSMFNGRITAGDNSKSLELHALRQMGRYTVVEIARSGHSRPNLNVSAYMLTCGLCDDGSGYVDLHGSVIIGRKCTPDGWVPQFANKMLKRTRVNGQRLVKEFLSFLAACLVDENASERDLDQLPFTLNRCEEVQVDLNIVASHGADMPTWFDEDPSVVLSYLSIRTAGDLRAILKSLARAVNDDWTLG